MLGFILILGYYSMGNVVKMIKLGQHAETIKKLAYTDVLTGMGNRMAFVEYKRSLISKYKNLGIAFVQFDINNLKTVNDLYGHDAGDKHIIAGASIISESFGNIGKCYRMGGDEFIAVISGVDAKTMVSNAEIEMNGLIDKYNSNSRIPVPLGIAYGTAFWDSSSKTAEEAECEADRIMYEKKREMKTLSEQ
jgi:diguanylate cyclase (GGDEF)-like protein